MTTSTTAQQDPFRTVTPYLVVRGCAKAIEFYKRAFDAVELLRNTGPDGVSIMHARLKIGDCIVMLNDEFPESGNVSPIDNEGCSFTLHLNVPNADAVFNKAVAAGAKVTMPLMDAFWGDRYGRLLDPYGHHWSVGHHLEKLSPKETRRRAAESLGG